MNSLVRYNTPSFLPSIFDEDFLTTHEALIDRIFNKAFPQISSVFGTNFFESGAYPKIDIRETETEFIIESEIPGLRKDQVKIEVKDDTLVIRGEKRSDEKKSGKYHIREIKRSSFVRYFTLPPEIVDKNSVKAKFQDGLLEVKINKIKPIPPPQPEIKQIDIE